MNYCADLTGADLTGANLTGADLTGADLTGANLVGANLEKAELSGDRQSGYWHLGAAQRLIEQRLGDGPSPPANLTGAKANEETIWPDGFDPVAAGVIFDD